MKHFVGKICGVVAVAMLGVLMLHNSSLAATFVVNNTTDGNDFNPGDGICEVNSGGNDCGIRAGIEETNAVAGADVLNFNIPGAGVHTFNPTSPYPNISEQLTIDGSTQPGASCGTLVPSIPAASNTPHTLLIEVDGTNLGWFYFDVGSVDSILRGINIHSGPDPSWISVFIAGATDTLVECNYIGTDPTGMSIPPSPAGRGINSTSAGTNTTIRNNIISGHLESGVFVTGQTAISNNLIGTDTSGNAALANLEGITQYYDLPLLLIDSNIISGNTTNGIGTQVLFDLNTEIVTITNNSIGRGLSGGVLGNGQRGVLINQVETLTLTGNTIAHNSFQGAYVRADDANITTNTFASNLLEGAYLESYHNPGDTYVFNSNIITNNTNDGALVYAENAQVDSNTATSNGGSGITSGNDGVTITNNTASNNTGTGIYFSASGATISGNTVFSNNGTGMVVGGTSNTISNNISEANSSNGFGISGNSYQMFGNQAINNASIGINVGSGSGGQIYGNFVGVDSGDAIASNGAAGVFVTETTSLTIGGDTPAERNIIAANTGSGIQLYACGSTLTQGVTITGNYIGTDVSGVVSAGHGNGGSGVQINEEELLGCGGGGGGGESIYKNIIGGDAAGEQNIIAGNAEDGVRIFQAPNTDVFSNTILPNSIFRNANLGINLAADTNNDGTADADLGPNALNSFLMTLPSTNANYYLNHPAINSSTISGNDIEVNYSFSANLADNTTLFQSDVVGYRLDFYLNDNTQDGAYAGYNQQKTFLGSFIVDGSTTNATHVFTSPVTPNDSMSISAVTTILWQTPGPP